MTNQQKLFWFKPEDMVAIDNLHNLAQLNSLSYTISYWESSNQFDVVMDGCGGGEHFSTFGNPNISYAVKGISEICDKFYKSLRKND